MEWKHHLSAMSTRRQTESMNAAALIDGSSVSSSMNTVGMIAWAST